MFAVDLTLSNMSRYCHTLQVISKTLYAHACHMINNDENPPDKPVVRFGKSLG